MYKKQRKFKTYQSLLMAIARNGVGEAGKCATLLLELFIEGGGKLYAQKAVGQGVCKSGSFREWRDNLVKLGWIDFDYNQAKADKDFSKHKAGYRLLPYLNKEKTFSKEVATTDELEGLAAKIEDGLKTKADILDVATKAELEEVKDRVTKIETSMTEIYDAFGLGETDPTEFQKLRNFQQELSKKEQH